MAQAVTLTSTLVWVLWAATLVAPALVFFAWYEIKTFLGAGLTLSEVVEASIRVSPGLYWTLLVSMLVLTTGWPLLILHWYTGVL
jgi:hypothetical protein